MVRSCTTLVGTASCEAGDGRAPSESVQAQIDAFFDGAEDVFAVESVREESEIELAPESAARSTRSAA